MRNRRYGPGGGTRRLHHEFLWGRNRIDVRNKGVFFARHGTTVIGLKTINGKVNFVTGNAFARIPANLVAANSDKVAYAAAA